MSKSLFFYRGLNDLSPNNNLVANIGPWNRHLVLKQCSSFSQSILPYHLLERGSNRLFKQIQSVSESEIHIFSSTAVRISRGTLCHLRVHQTQLNKK